MNTQQSNRDRLYAAKLRQFILEIERVPQAAKEKFKAKVNSSPEQFERLGEQLLLVLEKLSDTDRATIMARLFLAFLGGLLDEASLQRAWHAVGEAFFVDLKALLGEPSPFEAFVGNAHLRLLHQAGLTELEPLTVANVGPLDFQVSAFGPKVITAYNEAVNRYKRGYRAS